ncbi:glycosyl hydrolase [Cadophora sp. MPI-SDFR-AT-0126]|nr:glycosyl hydrolase [Leotiomycetes sp. MPI-SDFR-AT-0126]
MTNHSSLRLLQIFFTLLVPVNASFSNVIRRQNQNETHYNPAIPGWHSDPSCVFVAERDNTTFCTSSTFLRTPGLPVHASKDLKNWKLASHAISRKSQLPDYENSIAQSDGIWAATIRYHQGNFYIITMYRNNIQAPHNTLLIFKTSDPYSDSAWSDPIRQVSDSIDPDIFWDQDGTTYVASAGTFLQTVDLNTGNFSEARSIWNGTTGQWWSAALGWRSGPEAVTYPMGRETVMTPVTWNDGEFPVFTPLRGVQNAWTVPESKDVPGDGPFVTDPDIIGFGSNSTIPRHFGYWRWPDVQAYTISPPGHPGTLRLTPSTVSISAGATNLTAGFDVGNYTLMMRVQTDTLFHYSVDFSFAPQAKDEEAGVTVFLNQVQNMVLGIVMLPTNATGNSTLRTALAPHFRFMVSGLGGLVKEIPPPVTMPIPECWLQAPVRLSICAENDTHYTFYASSSSSPWNTLMVGRAPGSILSGGMGDFTGSLVGVYATSNCGNGSIPAYVSRWRYQGIAQEVDFGQFIPSILMLSN